MRFVWLILFIFVVDTFSFASELQLIPESCFEDELLCSSSYVTREMIMGKTEDVIHLNIFAMLSKYDYDHAGEVAEIFFDFSSWKRKVLNTGTKKVKIKKSLALSPSVNQDGVLIQRQYINYAVWGPPPFFYVNARAIGHYWLIDPIKGAILSGRFVHLNTGTHIIDGEDVLVGSEGYRYHRGDFHISEDASNYYLHFSSEMVPDIEILPTTVASYIENGYCAILSALYL